jgi:hypothetical protein
MGRIDTRRVFFVSSRLDLRKPAVLKRLAARRQRA